MKPSVVVTEVGVFQRCLAFTNRIHRNIIDCDEKKKPRRDYPNERLRKTVLHQIQFNKHYAQNSLPLHAFVSSK